MRASSTAGQRPPRHRRRHRPVQALAALLLAFGLAAAGCSANDSGMDSGDDKGGKAAAPGAGRQEDSATGAGGASGADKSAAKKPPKIAEHIIRTADLTVRVKDVPDALDKAQSAALDAGGIVGNETTDRDSKGHERSRVVLRVPQDKYQEVLAALEGTGRLIEKKVKAEDVSDQVVDVESRIKSQQASVARIRELMDRATKLSDVVTLEGELSSRQADLEALLAQREYLKDRTSLATITLTLSETAVKKKAVAEDDDPTFVDAIQGGWSAFVTALRWLTVILGAVLPFVAALLVLAFLYRLVRARLPRRTPALPTGAGAGAPTWGPPGPRTPDTTSEGQAPQGPAAQGPAPEAPQQGPHA
ncbi:DUF4349 domain-containing protein [Streptomyces sp. NBC_01304]|uniref:DUF4349 domain-containing protein n=1 Tax=Streptomyces sp. NBC_01304 TaxID=2903818 RepID=UPI002E0FD83B|nr:DUF4349 domain-containing protein [Streptomyces sp. NBC_01304]